MSFLNVEQLKKLMIELNPDNTNIINNLDEDDFAEYSLTELFEVVPGPYATNETIGKYPTIGITKSNDAHVGFSKEYEYPGGPYILIKCGNSGFIYKQNEPFAINNNSIVVLKAKPKLILLNKFVNLQLITLQLNKQFGYQQLKEEEFNDIKVLITTNSKLDINLKIFDKNSESRELIPSIQLDEDDDCEICSLNNKYIWLIIISIIFIIIGQFLSFMN